MRVLTLVIFGVALGLLAATGWSAVEIAWVDQHHPGSYYYTDCSTSSPHDEDIGWVSEYPVASGYGDGRYGPTDVVTREQMASFIVRQGSADWILAPLATDRYLFDGYYTGYDAYINGRISWDDYQLCEKIWNWMSACISDRAGSSVATATDGPDLQRLQQWMVSRRGAER